MTAFDHRTAGTSKDAWQASPLLRGLAPLTPPDGKDLVVIVAAHPDDETLGAGGLMAAASRAAAEVVVVVASDGEASHPRSRTTTPAELAERRRREVTAAVATVASGAQVHFLGLPDGQLSRHRAELARRLAPLAAHATRLVSPWRSDRHPDHEVCAEVTAELAKDLGAAHWQYPIWAWHWDDPAAPALPAGSLCGLPLTEADLAAKCRALACHVSQHTPLSAAAGDEAILPPEMVAHFLRDTETFVVEPPQDASSPKYFDDLYAGSDDPWGLQSRFYEQRKRELVLAALPRRDFGTAFEPGCSLGLLTEALAARCEQLIAWDVSPRALDVAAERTKDLPTVTLGRGHIPDEWPAAVLDLIVLSEVGYYVRDLDRLADRVVDSLTEDGVVIACHWRHPAPDHPHTAEAVHGVLDARLRCVVRHVEADFLLQVWSRSGRSVAQDEGIVD